MGPGMIMWNYEKFLVGRNGVPIGRWRSWSEPSSMEEDIKKALGL